MLLMCHLQELLRLLMRELCDAYLGMFTMASISRTYFFRASDLDMRMEVEPAECATCIKLFLCHVQELFQLLMRELFDADFGMFTMDSVSRTYYFRASGLEMNMEFELVGLLIGLAIYNGHILEVSLPMAIYK